MTGYQNVAPLANGVPQATLTNPFTSTNPLLPNFGPVAGKALGTNIGRGGENLLWYPQNLSKAFNDRFNISFERQLPGGFVASFTYFFNRGNQHYIKELNAINPNILQQFASNVTPLGLQVANPFYHYLNTTIINGPDYYQPTLPLSTFLVPYPQYGPMYTIGDCCGGERYNQIQFKGQRAFTKGFNFPVHLRLYSREVADQPLQRRDLLQQHVPVAEQRPATPPHEHRRHLRASFRQRPCLSERRSQSAGRGCGRLENNPSFPIHLGRFPEVWQPDRDRQPVRLQSLARATGLTHPRLSRSPRTLTCCGPTPCSTIACRARISGIWMPVW